VLYVGRLDGGRGDSGGLRQQVTLQEPRNGDPSDSARVLREGRWGPCQDTCICSWIWAHLSTQLAADAPLLPAGALAARRSAHPPRRAPLRRTLTAPEREMAQTVQAYQAAAPAPEDWRSKLKLPPKDTRFKTEVRADAFASFACCWAHSLCAAARRACAGPRGRC
jgi:hypothetical protein